MNKKLRVMTTSALVASAITSLIPMTQANAAIVEGATYYYTLDGSDPATSSTRQEWTDTSASQTIVAPDTDEESQVTIKVVAVKDGYANSDIVEKTVTFAAKKVIQSPILDPSTAFTKPNRGTALVEVKNTDDSGVNYYYTTDGQDPTVDNGTPVDNKLITIKGADEDTETNVRLKVVAEKNGEYSTVSSVIVTFSASTSGGDPGTGDTTISNPTISFNKTSPYNRQEGVKALILGKKSGVNYYYTTDGTEPTEASNRLSTSYIDIDAPDNDNADDVTVWVKGFKDGYAEEISAVQSIQFAAKVENKFHVTFKDRTYNDIETVEYNKGEAILSKAPSAPVIDGYEFIGWSNEDANVSKDMIIRAMYEKQQSEIKTHSPSEQIILAEEGSSSPDQVLITSSWPGTSVRVYTDEVSDTPSYDGTVDGAGECLVDVGNLDTQGGSVWVSYDTSGANPLTLSSEEEGVEVLRNTVMLAGSTKAFSPRKQVSYPSRAIAQIYSLPIPASRLALSDEKTLVVRGVDSGDKVNVYDKDNKLIGTSVQGRAPLMEISLSESVDATNVYVARVTPGRLESAQTELDKTALENNTVAQTLANVKQQIVSAFSSANFDESTVDTAIDTIIDGAIAFNSSDITGTKSNFINNAGHITVDIHLENTSGDTLDFNLDKNFIKDTSGSAPGTGAENNDLTVEQALAIIQNLNPKNFNESSELDAVLTKITTLLPSRITVDINGFANDGNEITFEATVKDQLSKQATGDVVYSYKDNAGDTNTGKPGEGSQVGQTAQEVLDLIKEELPKGAYDKTTNSDNLFNGIKHLFGSDVTVQLNTVNTGRGTITVDIKVSDSTGDTVSDTVKLAYSMSNIDEILEAVKSCIQDQGYKKGVTADKIMSDISHLITDVDCELTVTDDNIDTIQVDILLKDVDNNEATGSVFIIYDNSGSGGDGGDTGNGGGDTGNGGETDDTVSQDKVTIDKSGEQYADEVAEKIKIYLDAYTPTNESEEAVLDGKFQDICNATTSAGVTVETKDWSKANSTTEKRGVLQFVVDVFNEAGDKAKVTFDKFISKLSGGDTGNGGDTGEDVTDADFNKAVKEVSNYLSTLKASNTSRKSVVMDKIAGICDKYVVSCDIEDWVLETSSRTKRGNLSFDVKIIKGDNSTTLSYNKDIAKKSSSSSSGSSSSSSNSGSSSDNESSSDIGSTSPDSNGGSITVGGTTSNGGSTGNKVTINGGSGGGTSVNLGSGAGNVVAVYKYEPTTGKYIKLPDGFTVSGASIKFNSEANTEYFLANKELSFDMVLNEGWNKTDKGTFLLNGLQLVTGWKELNGQWYYMDDNSKARVENNWKQLSGKWYYLGQEGIMQTGWIYDKGNWYYLNPWSGDMATGWKQVGSNWYYLHAYNGAMQTGWHQVGAHWFYLYGDGHMASAETIDGYYLNSDGRWV